MFAARMYNKNDIRVEQIPIPAIKSMEILLKVKAVAVCGTDIRMYRNGYPGITEETPRVLGHELAGIIEQVGAEVEGYEIGQKVAVAPNMGCGICIQCVAGNGHLCPDYKALGINIDGGFAEYVMIPSRAVASGNVMPLAPHVSFAEAAVNEALSCVYNGFERADIRPGDNVVVIGAGPIGIMHGMLAKMAGASRVIFNDLSQERLDLVKRFDPFFTCVKDYIKEEVMTMTNQLGADAVIVACPAPKAQTLSLELCAINARVSMFGGVPATAQPVGLDTNLIHYKQLIVSGTTRASLTHFRKTLGFVASGVLDIKPLISGTFSLDEISMALERAEKAEGLKNVIVFS